MKYEKESCRTYGLVILVIIFKVEIRHDDLRGGGGRGGAWKDGRRGGKDISHTHTHRPMQDIHFGHSGYYFQGRQQTRGLF